jgi:MFS family permease
MLMAARLMQGAGISLLVNSGLRGILKARPGRGTAMTYFGIAATAGGVFGLQIGGSLTQAYGWRSIFLMSAAIALIAVATSARYARSKAPQAEPTAPGVPESPSQIPSLAYLAIPVALNFLVFVNYSMWVVLPLYAERSFASTPSATANLLMVITVVHLLAAVPLGMLIRRVGSEMVLVLGMIAALAGTLCVLAAPSETWLGLPLMLYGAGQVAAVNSAGDIVLQRGHASLRAISLVRLSSDLGLVLGPVAIGLLADQFGLRAPFLALPTMMGVAAVIAALLMIRAHAN